MLKRRYRLKSPAMFKRTLNAARLCANRNFVAYGLAYKPEHDSAERDHKSEHGTADQATRFGFIVSTKVHKRATRRNRIKRWFREIIRKDILALAPPYKAVVIIARQGMLEAEYDMVRNQLLQCMGVRI